MTEEGQPNFPERNEQEKPNDYARLKSELASEIVVPPEVEGRLSDRARTGLGNFLSSLDSDRESTAEDSGRTKLVEGITTDGTVVVIEQYNRPQSEGFGGSYRVHAAASVTSFEDLAFAPEVIPSDRLIGMRRRDGGTMDLTVLQEDNPVRGLFSVHVTTPDRPMNPTFRQGTDEPVEVFPLRPVKVVSEMPDAAARVQAAQAQVAEAAAEEPLKRRGFLGRFR